MASLPAAEVYTKAKKPLDMLPDCFCSEARSERSGNFISAVAGDKYIPRHQGHLMVLSLWQDNASRLMLLFTVAVLGKEKQSSFS